MFVQEDCDPPPTPDDTSHNGCAAPYIHNEVCTYQCDDGFSKTGGDKQLTCDDGKWDGEELECKEDCDPPPTPDDTSHNGCEDPYIHDTECDYVCDAGFSKTGGDDSLTCNDGNWDGEELECKEDCDPPPTPDDTSHNGCDDPYIHDEECDYVCDAGFSKTGGDDSLTCNDGNWDGEELECKENCDPPPTPDDTSHNGCDDPYIHDEECDYVCDAGFSKTGGDDSLTCNDGNWDGEELECKEDCGAPPMPTGTTHTGCAAPYIHDVECNYQCKTGYSKDGGDDKLTCNDGNWDGEELECKEDCTAPPSATNASSSGCTPPYKHGAACDYQCDAGYSVKSGDPTLTCNDGNWDGAPLVCDPITTPAPNMVWG
ncbi:PREDICTED: E-selectin-like [Branchiostoma belcheri]|uniref:E-selectin-like n=1 Tax=Branchiostoma belcheri TaxID=7741 RepID=A0A6P5AIX0_BRABE|nr:PREDICTED: E-selectin-like [Branchiostoma belcheri]